MLNVFTSAHPVHVDVVQVKINNILSLIMSFLDNSDLSRNYFPNVVVLFCFLSLEMPAIVGSGSFVCSLTEVFEKLCFMDLKLVAVAYIKNE
jgi:hypothetical protein